MLAYLRVQGPGVSAGSDTFFKGSPYAEVVQSAAIILGVSTGLVLMFWMFLQIFVEGALQILIFITTFVNPHRAAPDSGFQLS